jgi:hypothetical protein
VTKIEEFVLSVQKEVCKVKREVENEFHKSKYADLEGVLDILNPFFIEQKVLVDQSPEYDSASAAWRLKTVFSIENHFQTWYFPLLGLDSKTPMQSLGSAITYARRYQLKSIFKLVDSDDDANAVTPKGEPSKPARKAEVDKMLRAFAALNIAKTEVEQIVQTDADKLTIQDMENLKTAYNAIKSKKKTLADYTTGDQEWQD